MIGQLSRQMDHETGMKAAQALARLPPAEIASLLPHLSHAMYCMISEILTNILYYDVGKQMSVRKRNRIKRVMTDESLRKFRELATVRLSQKVRRALIMELKNEIGVVLSETAEFLNRPNQNASRQDGNQGDQILLSQSIPHPRRINESALFLNEAKSTKGTDETQ